MQMRIKLKNGDREIEVEGDVDVVEDMLDKWWTNVPAAAPKSQGTKKRGSRADTEKPASSSFDVNALSNQIKEMESFPAMEEKILHKRGDHWNKTALVLSCTEQGLTSGEITKVLISLGSKTSNPRVSEALDRNTGSLLPDQTRRLGSAPRYKLTGAAAKEIKALLSGKPGEQGS